MKNEQKLSIIINNYNYGRFLGECIETALEQNYPHTEVIVVDDGSNDDSPAVIERYEKHIIPVFKKNLGQASAFNAGFEVSSGDVLLFLDSDDRFCQGKGSRIIDIFKKTPLAGWVFHQVGYVDEQGLPLPLSIDYGIREELAIDVRQELVRGKRFYCPLPATSALCFKRTLLKTILPMPVSNLRTGADRFLKIAAIYLSAGVYNPEKLSLQRIHGLNAYSFRPDVWAYQATRDLMTAFYLRETFPSLVRYTDKDFAGSLGRLVGKIGLNNALSLPECRQYIKRYYSPARWCVYIPRLTFYIMRTLIDRLFVGRTR